MKKVKLKKFVLPTVYFLLVAAVFVSISYAGNALKEKIEYGDMTVSNIKEDDVVPVIKEEEVVEKSKITVPYTGGNVTVSKGYYDMKDTPEDQQKSLVYYEKTYLQNSGILYTSDNDFDIVSAYDGTVTKVSKDEILGDYIEITHNPNLKTIYYSLKNINVSKDDVVTSGMIIAKSGDNMLDGEKENCLLFEVFYNGYTMDPDYFYTLNIDDLN